MLGPEAFGEADLLLRGFKPCDLDAEGRIDIESLRLPDLSCNWDRFSLPQDVRMRDPSTKSDGCYGVAVLVYRYKNFATPVHDPICHGHPQNYSHVEVRQLEAGQSIHSVPARHAKKKKSEKTLRLEWRKNIALNLKILLEPDENIVGD